MFIKGGLFSNESSKKEESAREEGAKKKSDWSTNKVKE